VNSKSRICLTGGARFIGKAVAQDLAKRGHEVIALDILNPQVHVDLVASVAEFPGEVDVGDVKDPSVVRMAMKSCDLVVHLAAETGVTQSMYEAERYISVNTFGTRVVAAAAASQVAGMTLFSSRDVCGQGAYCCPSHGRSDTGRCCEVSIADASRESDDLVPVSIYGQSKAAAEQAAAEETRECIPLAILRPQSVVGAGQAPHNPYTGVLAAFAARLAAGLPPQIYGSGMQTRDFVDVKDVARVVTWVTDEMTGWHDGLGVLASRSVPMVMNVGSGTRTTLTDLAKIAGEVSGRSLGVPIHLDVTREGDIDHACADMSFSSEIGAPHPRIPLTESVREFLEHVGTLDPVDPGIWDRALDEAHGRASSD